MNLLISLAIGKHYTNLYNELFYPSQKNYANKCGYDFKLIDHKLPNTIDHPDAISFDKILCFCQDWSMQYDKIIFVDADIFINPDSPPIDMVCDDDYISVIDEWNQPNSTDRIKVQRKMGWETSATDYYRLAGFDITTTRGINTGVIVANPKKYGSFFQQIYNTYAQYSPGHPRNFHFEQSAIGYQLQKNNICKYLDNRYNAIYAIYKYDNPTVDLVEFVQNNFFTHFAGKFALDKVCDLNSHYNL